MISLLLLSLVSGQNCSAGFYCPDSTPVLCPAGSYCLQNSISPTPCPAGTYSAKLGISAKSECLQCPGGSYCNVACTKPVPCPEKSYCPNGSTFPRTCPVGKSCPASSASPLDQEPKGGLSKGAIAGIFIGAGFVALAVIAFVVTKGHQRRKFLKSSVGDLPTIHDHVINK